MDGKCTNVKGSIIIIKAEDLAREAMRLLVKRRIRYGGRAMWVGWSPRNVGWIKFYTDESKKQTTGLIRAEIVPGL